MGTWRRGLARGHWPTPSYLSESRWLLRPPKEAFGSLSFPCHTIPAYPRDAVALLPVLGVEGKP